MINRLSLYGKKVMRLICALRPVQGYRLQRAYLLEAYDQFPMLRQQMVVLWLKLAPAVGVGLSMSTIELPMIARLSLALACVLYFLWLYPQAYGIYHEESRVAGIYRLSCAQSKFLRRN